jgi:beta-mannanase
VLSYFDQAEDDLITYEMADIKPTASPTSAPATTPIITRKIKFGVVVDDYENKVGGVSDIENKLNTRISSISIYKHFGLPHNRLLSQTDLSYIKSKGYNLHVAWEPFNPLETTQSVDYLAEIPTGRHDAYIREFVRELKNYPGQVMLRFAHEMNGDWYPWGLRPEEYKNAYRHIAGIVKEEGAGNVLLMWSINSESTDGPISTVNKYYPGADVVDVIGVDVYNYGTSQSWSKWRTFREIFAPSYDFLVRTYSHPIVISELASAEIGGNKPDWIKETFANDLQNRFTKVDEVIWFNLLKETDWRVDSTESTLSIFQQVL